MTDIKTIWHWKNIGKVTFTALLAAVGVAVLVVLTGIGSYAGFVLGYVVGVIATAIALDRWEIYHFE